MTAMLEIETYMLYSTLVDLRALVIPCLVEASRRGIDSAGTKRASECEGVRAA